jgi:hypothetical protein
MISELRRHDMTNRGRIDNPVGVRPSEAGFALTAMFRKAEEAGDARQDEEGRWYPTPAFVEWCRAQYSPRSR